jgi:hypothetical protein
MTVCCSSSNSSGKRGRDRTSWLVLGFGQMAFAIAETAEAVLQVERTGVVDHGADAGAA